eukprot:Skav232065  [mRNA]  locus=scaffold1641:170388:170597:+ [translate_table: standard]
MRVLANLSEILKSFMSRLVMAMTMLPLASSPSTAYPRPLPLPLMASAASKFTKSPSTIKRCRSQEPIAG